MKANTTLFLSPKENETDLFQENVNVMIQDLSGQPMDLEAYTQLTKQQITEALGAHVIESLVEMKLAGHEAKKMVYLIPKDPMAGRNVDLKVEQVWFIKDNRAYLLTYTALKSKFEEYLPTAHNIVESFKLK